MPPFFIILVLFCITSIFLHKEIMLLVQIISCDVKSFAESLEVNDFSFPQEAEGSKNGGVICQSYQIFYFLFFMFFTQQIYVNMNSFFVFILNSFL